MAKSKKNTTSLDFSMEFELSMRQFFGDEGYKLAGVEYSKDIVCKWLQKAIKKMMKDVMEIDTTTRHKERMVGDLEQLLGLTKKSEDPWRIIYRLFFLCSRFLGYDYITGTSYHIPFYHQTRSQNFYSKVAAGTNDSRDEMKDRENILTKQKGLIEVLKKDGFDDFKIGLILGMSEYKVKKLRKGI